MKAIILISLTVILLVQCQTNGRTEELENTVYDKNEVTTSETNNHIIKAIDTLFDRSTIKTRLKDKINKGVPLVVHIYIPLCDNDHQGIVPTSPSLGDGLNLKTNLYWATSGGTKGYFKKQPEWKTVYNGFDIDPNVLERIVFLKKYNNTKVYLVADAYRGDRMETTINDYLAAISNNRHDTIMLKDSTFIAIAGASDLIIFNGHNGVMDNITIKPWVNSTEKRTDIVMNACLSYDYLKEELMVAGGYPLVRTNTLLYPGAYVLEQIVDDWVSGEDEVQLCLNAGRAYCIKHNCGRGSKVYKSGW